jgi:hypothetical protein
MSGRGADMKKAGRVKKTVKAYRRGGLWYDPMCFPEFEKKTDR